MTVDATLINTFGGGTISYALNIGIDRSTGDVLVGDEFPYKIHRYSAAGSLLAQYSYPGGIDGSSISGIAGDSAGKIWVSDFYPNGGYPRVYRLSATGTYETGFYSTAYPNTEIMEPNDLTIAPSGKIYVTSSNYYAYEAPYLMYGTRLAADGSFEESFGTGYSGNQQTLPPEGQLLVPTGIAADSGGNVYIADAWGPYKTVNKFAADGTFTARWGGVGSGDGLFTRDGFNAEIWYVNGMKIAVDAQDRIFVTDKWAGRVNVFDAAGTSLGAFGTGTLVHPVGIACGLNGSIFVMDESTQEVTEWAVSGAPEFQIRGVSVVVCGDTDC